VLPLAEIQSLVQRGVLFGEISRLTPLLAGGQYPERRFAIHQRHYETSLIAALLDKFPATVWLAGARLVTETASRFVHESPPQAPCIAEYGGAFPEYLSECSGAEHMPYLGDFAQLEWHVGHVAIAVDVPPVSIERLSIIPSDALPDTFVTLQPGVRYFRSSWPVDELMKLYLNDTAPECFSMDGLDIWLELRGERGKFHIKRLDAASFIFRESFSCQDCSLVDAAERALDVDAVFDPGVGFSAMIAEGLVAAIAHTLP
jgi:hypothetical protein